MQATRINYYKDNIMDHLWKFQVIERSQHGFTRNRSCLTNLLEYLEFISSNFDTGIPVVLFTLIFHFNFLYNFYLYIVHLIFLEFIIQSDYYNC